MAIQTRPFDFNLAAMAVSAEVKKNLVFGATFTNYTDTEAGYQGQTFSVVRSELLGDVQEITPQELYGDNGVTEQNRIYNDSQYDVVSVTLNTIISYGAKVRIDDATFVITELNLASTSNQFVTPIVNKLVNYVEVKGLGVLTTASKATVNGVSNALPDRDLSAANPEKVGALVRRTFNRINTVLSNREHNGVRPTTDQANLFLAVGTEVKYWILADDTIGNRVDASGSDAALRRAEVLPLSGFTIFTDNKLQAETVIAYTKDAIGMFTRAPATSQGAKFSTVLTDNGIAFRYNVDYSTEKGSDVVLMDAFLGFAVMNPEFVVSQKFVFPGEDIEVAG